MNEWWNKDYNTFISWGNLDADEQDEARYKFKEQKADELEVSIYDIDENDVETCDFERTTGGDIIVYL